MAKRTIAAKPAEPVCRLVSLRADSQSASAHELSERKLELRTIGAGVAIVALLVFAAMGLVFNAKHRQPKPERQAMEPGIGRTHKSVASNHANSRGSKVAIPQPILPPEPPAPARSDIAKPVPKVPPPVSAARSGAAEPIETSAFKTPEPIVTNEMRPKVANGAATTAPALPAKTISDDSTNEPNALDLPSNKLGQTDPPASPATKLPGK